MPLCGDFGGLNADGAPCGRKVTSGPCRFHTSDASKEIAEKKAQVIEEYGSVPVLELACRTAEVGRTTVFRWRQLDPEFDRQIREIEDRAPATRRQMVEETLFVRIVRGKAAAAETIFWLINDSRRQKDGRWQDVKILEKRKPQWDPTLCTEEELQRIAKGEDPEDVLAERGVVR